MRLFFRVMVIGILFSTASLLPESSQRPQIDHPAATGQQMAHFESGEFRRILSERRGDLLYQILTERFSPGIYHFADCPFEKRSNRLVPLCLNGRQGADETFAIEISAELIDQRGAPGERLLEQLRSLAEGRRIEPELRLLAWRHDESSGRVEWLVRLRSYRYTAPLFEQARQRFSEWNEAQLFGRNSAQAGEVSVALLRDLLPLFDNRNRGRLLNAELALFLPPDRTLPFRSGCPLRLLSEPQREVAANRIEIEFGIECLNGTDHYQQRAVARLPLDLEQPVGEGDRGGGFEWQWQVGALFYADLRLDQLRYERSRDRLMFQWAAMERVMPPTIGADSSVPLTRGAN